jgi:hypothetical protein
MLYVFTSSACASVTYTGAVGEDILRHAGRTVAAQGVIPYTDIAAVRNRLRQAVADEHAAAAGQRAGGDEDDAEAPPAVPLARRLVPFFELLDCAESAAKDVTWGL